MQNKRKKLIWWITLFCGMGAVCGSVAGRTSRTSHEGPSIARIPRYQITEMPTLGGAASAAFAINEKGQVVGWAETTRQLPGIEIPSGMGFHVKTTPKHSVTHAVLWEGGTLRDLAAGVAAPDYDSRAESLNNQGAVVINQSGPYLTAEAHALVCKNKKTFVIPVPSKKHLPVSEALMFASKINDKGQVAGTRTAQMGFDRYYRSPAFAYTWTQGGAPREMVPGSLYTFANGINQRGDIVGQAETKPAVTEEAGLQAHAALWRAGSSTLTDLGTLGKAPCESEAADINDREQVVGFSYLGPYYNGNRTPHAFLWQNGRMTDLGASIRRTEGMAPIDTIPSYATAINNHGQVVGYAQVGGSDVKLEAVRLGRETHAFLWQNNQALDLNAIIDPASGWFLEAAKDINDKGQIVGAGTHNGKHRGFLLTPVK